MAEVMTDHLGVAHTSLDLEERIWPTIIDNEAYPYEDSVKLLSQITLHVCPLKKLEIIGKIL